MMQLKRRAFFWRITALGAWFYIPNCRKETGFKHHDKRLNEWLPVRLEALQAAAECILPGAVEAGAFYYITYWLRTPAYHWALREFDVAAMFMNRLAMKNYQKNFAQCAAKEQDAILDRFQKDQVHGKFKSSHFFRQFTTLILESYLGEPKYGGNRMEVGWQLIGKRYCWWAPLKRVFDRYQTRSTLSQQR